jgi:hypothetical protein
MRELQYATFAPGTDSSLASILATKARSTVSSESRKSSQRPVAASMPRLRAADTPFGAPSWASNENLGSRET